jgi:cytochrome b561/polyisoprenoid-binding protein YceI
MVRPNTSDLIAQHRYSSVAILLHWLLALTLAFQTALGFAMPKDESGFAAYQLHKSVGIVILLLTLLRLAWRLGHRPPPAVESGFTSFLAKAVHTGFYVVLILAPLTGWALVSTAEMQVPTVLFGTVPWPHMPLPSSIYETTEEAHEMLSWVGIGLFVLHVTGALRHQLLMRDRLLERMAPAGSAALVGVLSALLLAIFAATLFLASSSGPAVEAQEKGLASFNQPDLEEYGVLTEEGPPEPESEDTPEPQIAEPAEETESTAAQVLQPDPPSGWTIRPGGRLGFSVRSGDDVVRGSFAEWGGTIRMDPENPEDADIHISVDLGSASVGDTTMDGMLQGAEFFAASANPTATWRAASIRRTGPGSYSAQGTLSLKGTSRSVPLTFTLSGEGLRRRVRGNATVDRTAFGIGISDSGQSLGQAVSLDFAFDAVGRKP